jgi:sirohydrochlorin ferrochelatase
MADMLGERLGGVPVVPAYASALAPTVPAAVEALTARGRHRIAVASYFAAPGLFATRSAAAAPWIAAEPLGTHPALARLLLHRYDQARALPRAVRRLELSAA